MHKFPKFEVELGLNRSNTSSLRPLHLKQQRKITFLLGGELKGNGRDSAAQPLQHASVSLWGGKGFCACMQAAARADESRNTYHELLGAQSRCWGDVDDDCRGGAKDLDSHGKIDGDDVSKEG